MLDYRGSRAVVSGDYKRRPDPTCAPFEPVRCDVFVTEATFGLPVFRHPPDGEEIERLLHSVRLFPERAHVVGVYALGKCQRVIALLRRHGWDRPIYLHGALIGLTELYRSLGVELGRCCRRPARGATSCAAPSCSGRPGRRRSLGAPAADPAVAMASGWMRVRQRAKQRGVELPLVISDHADWDELLQTFADVAAGEIWVTHGREEAILRQAELMGLKARALSIAGLEEEEAQ